MGSMSIARVRSADVALRTALVELDGSEGTAVPARLGDGVHPRLVAPGAECVVVTSPAGERVLVATVAHQPADAPLLGASVSSSTAPAASFAYSDGTAWTDALTASVRTLSPCELWASGWLSLQGSAASAAAVWELRIAVDTATPGPAIGWGSALANLHQVCALSARVTLAAAGLWTVRLQIRVKAPGVTATCAGGLLLAEARAV